MQRRGAVLRDMRDEAQQFAGEIGDVLQLFERGDKGLVHADEMRPDIGRFELFAIILQLRGGVPEQQLVVLDLFEGRVFVHAAGKALLDGLKNHPAGLGRAFQTNILHIGMEYEL